MAGRTCEGGTFCRETLQAVTDAVSLAGTNLLQGGRTLKALNGELSLLTAFSIDKTQQVTA